MSDAQTLDCYFKMVDQIKDLCGERGLSVWAAAPVPAAYVIRRGQDSVVGFQLHPRDPQVLVVARKFHHLVPLDVLLWEIDLATVDEAVEAK